LKLPAVLADLPGALLPLDEEPIPPESGARQSAVMVLLYPRGGVVNFVLTKRPETMPRHPGQISLPGGVREARDTSLWETSVRETVEEIGLRPGRLIALGRLEAYHLRVSDYVIHPFVGWNPIRPSFRIHRTEVDELIEVPIDWLLDPAAVLEETWELRGRQWLVTFYRFGERDVWGATAHILASLAQRLQHSLDYDARHPGSVSALSGNS
jgi:8-oxo-dGTP pyrophosphatase MutT (NUDIX family)